MYSAPVTRGQFFYGVLFIGFFSTEVNPLSALGLGATALMLLIETNRPLDK